MTRKIVNIRKYYVSFLHLTIRNIPMYGFVCLSFTMNYISEYNVSTCLKRNKTDIYLLNIIRKFLEILKQWILRYWLFQMCWSNTFYLCWSSTFSYQSKLFYRLLLTKKSLLLFFVKAYEVFWSPKNDSYDVLVI